MNEKLTAALEALLGKENVFADEPMSAHTSFQAGGPADLFIRVCDAGKTAQVLRILREEGVPYFIMGRGTNLLVSDAGYRGCVMTMVSPGARPITDTALETESGRRDLDRVYIRNQTVVAGAGASLAQAARTALQGGLSGLEFAAGIPGSVGGGISMNAGAYGGELRDVTVSVTVLGAQLAPRTLGLEEMEFGYRTSRIRRTGEAVLEAVFRLTPEDPEKIREKMQTLARQRAEKQPLEYPSAGSTFKRPEGNYAGKLIMEAGLCGFRVGGACVSEKHCGFIINDRGASASEIRELIAQVQKRVYENSGVMLEREVIYLGE